MKTFSILLFSIIITSSLLAQPPKREVPVLKKHWVQLKDKANTPYSIFRPEEFLSPKALQRRENQGIQIDFNDLPIDPTYVKAILATGVKLHNKSKWLNGVVVYAENDAVIEDVKKLPFVDFVESIGLFHKKKFVKKEYPAERNEGPDYVKSDNPYGYAYNQISMLNGQYLHERGYQGQGLHVAIFDGGFDKVDQMPAFDSIRANGRFLGTYDFVDMDEYVYESSNHGTNVLSTMGADLPGLIIGTSPKAFYYLFKTEDTRSEYPIEETNWLAAAEYADSIGVDVINSSLGYYSFDLDSLSYSYEDMNGRSARITKAGNIAASKGILVVNSAGNAGNSKWKYIGAPADADSVLTVAAVNRSRRKAGFSSFGPAADGRVKPNVAARGQRTVVAGKLYSTKTANGTSFSSPVMAGMATAFWQAFPKRNNMEIFHAIEDAGSQFDSPDAELGFGIPDFIKAYRALNANTVFFNARNQAFVIDRPVEGGLEIILEETSPDKAGTKVEVSVKNFLGQEVFYEKNTIRQGINFIDFPEMSELPKGAYLVTADLRDYIYRAWIYKN